MPFPSILTHIMVAMCADLPELGLLGKESRIPGLEKNGYEHRIIAAFIQNVQFQQSVIDT